MILTTEEHPIWRLAYHDHDDLQEDGTFARVVIHTDYLEVTDTVVIYGRHLSCMGITAGEVEYNGDGPERTVVPREALLWADCYSDSYARLWAKEGMADDIEAGKHEGER